MGEDVRQTQGGLILQLDAALRGVARILGFDLPNPILRYTIVLVAFAVIAVVALVAHDLFATIALSIGFLGITAAARQWAWRRGKIQQAILDAEDLSTIEPDRGNDGIVTAALLVVLSPILFYRVGAQPDAFTMPESYNALTPWPWIMLTLGELAKAVPIVDYSEIYGLRNFSGITPNTLAAQSAVFLTRALDDFVLLNAFFAYVQQAGALRHAASLISPPTPNFELLGARLQQLALVFYGVPRLPLPQSFTRTPQLLKATRDPLRRAAYLTGMVSVPIRRVLERTGASAHSKPARNPIAAHWQSERDRRLVAELVGVLDRWTYDPTTPQFLKVACTNARIDLWRWSRSLWLERGRGGRKAREVGHFLEERLIDSFAHFASVVDRVGDAGDEVASALIYELGLVFSYRELVEVRYLTRDATTTLILNSDSAFEKLDAFLVVRFKLGDSERPGDIHFLSNDEEILLSSCFFTLIAIIANAWNQGIHEKRQLRLVELISLVSQKYGVSPELRGLLLRRAKGVLRGHFQDLLSALDS